MSGSVTATIAVSPSTVQVGQKVTATVSFTSTVNSAVTVTGMEPYAIITGASFPMPASVAYGIPNLQANNSAISIAASGTATIPFDLTFFAPSTGLLSNGSNTYDVGCQCQTSDGSVFHPTAATVTVNNITFASSQQ
jgi:hypothetical protein